MTSQFLPPYKPGDVLSISGTQWSNGSQTGLLAITNYSGWETVVMEQNSNGGMPDFAAMAAWGFNCVRLPFNEAAWMERTCVDANGNQIKADPQGTYRAGYEAVITAAHAAGLYTIRDLHWTISGNALPRAQDAMANTRNSLPCWTDMATSAITDEASAFELFNEPALPMAAGTIYLADGVTIATTEADYAEVILNGGFGTQIAYQSVVGPNYFESCHLLQLSGAPSTPIAVGDTVSQNSVSSRVYDFDAENNTVAVLASVTGWTVGALTFASDITAAMTGMGKYGFMGYQQGVDAVRATGATQAILIGMNGYSNNIQDWLANVPTDPLKQISCSNHPYYYCEGVQTAVPVNAGSGYFGMTGTVGTGTSGNPGSLTDPAQNWVVNAHVGRYVYSNNAPYKVLSNTATELILGDANGNQTWAAPSGAYTLGDLLVLPQGVGCYFPAWLLVSAVNSAGGITAAYAQMPIESTSGMGQGRGGLYLAFGASGSAIPANPVAPATSSGKGTGATFDLTWGFSTGSPASNPATAWPLQNAILAAGYPITITETGDYSAPGMTAAQAFWINTIIARCQAAGISFGCWTFNVWAWQWQFNTLIQNATGTPTPGFGAAVQAFTQSLISGAPTTMKTTLTIGLPTTRAGVAAPASQIASINIYKNGAKYVNVAPTTTTWSDTVTAVEGDAYTVTAMDTQNPSVESAHSGAYTVTDVVTALPPFDAPTLSGVTA
jgi:hypothetical protein